MLSDLRYESKTYGGGTFARRSPHCGFALELFVRQLVSTPCARGLRVIRAPCIDCIPKASLFRQNVSTESMGARRERQVINIDIDNSIINNNNITADIHITMNLINMTIMKMIIMIIIILNQRIFQNQL